MVRLEDIIARDGYLVDSVTGEKVIFYECDPEKNTECERKICRVECDEDEGSFGFCSKTLNPQFCKDGGRAWYAVLKQNDDDEEPYWGREYLEAN